MINSINNVCFCGVLTYVIQCNCHFNGNNYRKMTGEWNSLFFTTHRRCHRLPPLNQRWLISCSHRWNLNSPRVGKTHHSCQLHDCNPAIQVMAAARWWSCDLGVSHSFYLLGLRWRALWRNGRVIRELILLSHTTTTNRKITPAIARTH